VGIHKITTGKSTDGPKNPQILFWKFKSTDDHLQLVTM